MSHITTSKIIINTSAAQVWDALTKPELVKQWQYGSGVVTDWKKGSAILYRSEWEGKIFEQKGTILEIEKPTLVKYSLFAPHPDLEDEPKHYFTMTYLLEEFNGKTTLTIVQEDPREAHAQAETEESDNSVLNSLKKLVEG